MKRRHPDNQPVRAEFGPGPGSRRGTGAEAGFTPLELMFVVAIIGLMALLAVPAYFRTQAATAKGNCINNLRVIDVAKEMYALDQNLPNGASVTGNDIELFLKVPYSAIVEPLNGTYYINAIGVEPECSLGEPHVLP